MPGSSVPPAACPPAPLPALPRSGPPPAGRAQLSPLPSSVASEPCGHPLAAAAARGCSRQVAACPSFRSAAELPPLSVLPYPSVARPAASRFPPALPGAPVRCRPAAGPCPTLSPPPFQLSRYRRRVSVTLLSRHRHSPRGRPCRDRGRTGGRPRSARSPAARLAAYPPEPETGLALALGRAAGPHSRQRHRVPSRPKAESGAFGAGCARSRGRRCPRSTDPGLPAAGGGAARPHRTPPAMPGSQRPRQAAGRSTTCRPLQISAPGRPRARSGPAARGVRAGRDLTKSTWRSCSPNTKAREGYRGRAAGPPSRGPVKPCPLMLTCAGTMAGGQPSWHPSCLSTPQVPERHTHCCHLGSFICFIFPAGPVQQVGPHLCCGVHSSSPRIYSAQQHSQAKHYNAWCFEKVRYLQVVKMQPLGIKYMNSFFHMLKGKKERNSILFLIKPPSISLLIQYLIFFPGHTVFQTLFSAQS